MNRPARPAGFTLLEVLVALAIFAIVAAVVLTAAARSVRNAGRLPFGSDSKKMAV